jgi:hypothetical protein
VFALTLTGSCILLLHWSLLNYAAVAKILKKHDKLTGMACLSGDAPAVEFLTLPMQLTD